jgi:hypothetical protein
MISEILFFKEISRKTTCQKYRQVMPSSLSKRFPACVFVTSFKTILSWFNVEWPCHWYLAREFDF